MAVCLWVRGADMLCVSTFVAISIQWWVSHIVNSGAQVGVASFVVNFLVDQNIGISKSKASQLFSFCQITFTVGRSAIRKSSGIDRTHCISRFVGVAILNFVDPALLLTLYAICCCVFCGSIVGLPGQAAVGCLFALFFFESICYPVRISSLYMHITF